MRYPTWLLLPISWLYRFIVECRNYLYDSGILKSFRFNLPVIVVGNLTIGGTGKTPMIEYLVGIMKKERKVAILSRGYKRKTSGFRIAGDKDNAHTLGDESCQLYQKFKSEVIVTVGEDRVYAIPCILEEYPETEVIVLDDAFQHRRLNASFQILITDYNRLFYEDWVLPAGKLREGRNNARRADVIVVSKCPRILTDEKRSYIIAQIKKYSGAGKPVFFTSISYEEPYPVGATDKPINQKIMLVTGIANPDPLVEYLSTKYEILKHFRFRDHHFFTKGDIDSLVDYYNQVSSKSVSILLTEKDFYRIANTVLEKKLRKYPIYFQPITYKFVQCGKEFDQLILETIGNYTN
jgi:tetraacyldisaccharide 4'-kinase